ncbi:MAG TPA: EAL domain-containing protein [Solirubrobacteraceae bacterium]|nr:EAL domain-containing protein [Solirubrobacteraceae bacterium]
MSPFRRCSTHQLAEFLAAVSSFPDERAAVTGALDRAAAAFEAEVAAVVRDGAVEASIGFGHGEAPAAELVVAAEGGQQAREISGLGHCRTASVPLDGEWAGTLLLARVGDDEFTPEELNLLRAMARVLELALEMLRNMAQERHLRQQAEEQAIERQRAERRLATQHAIARVLAASATAEAAFVPVLRTLGRELGAACGVVWLADEWSECLRSAGIWRSSAARATFEPRSGCARSDGLAGRVWSDGAAAWDPGAPASANGAVGAPACPSLAVPIADGPHVVGVIELVGSKIERPDPAALEMLTSVGAQVSQFLTRRRAEEQLAHQALHDALTGLPNRTLLLDRIAHASERAIRTGTSLAVLFLDIDRFKNVNDSLGHQAGDRLLVALAERLTAIVRASDTVARVSGTVARLAGDEFVVLCEDLRDEHDAVHVAERIVGEATAPFDVDGNELEISLSIGIAVSGGVGSPPEQLIRDADLAMYRAKEAGRDRYELFDAPMRTRVLERIELENDLRKALARDQLQLHYQPLVSLGDRSIVGAEALLRWEHPGRGLVPPLEFVPIAEDSGLIGPIGEWILNTACRQLAEWSSAGACPPHFSVAVNLSPRQLTPGLPQVVANAVRASGIDPSSLTIEITESVLVDEAESPAELLRELKSLGVRLVLDDFGTGYSSLSYLHRFELDGLKLDRSFISRLGHDSSGSKLVAASIDMARALDLTVVAEGVETEGQLDCLRELSCPLAQGYLFARPPPAQELTALLQAGEATASWRTPHSGQRMYQPAA